MAMGWLRVSEGCSMSLENSRKPLTQSGSWAEPHQKPRAGRALGRLLWVAEHHNPLRVPLVLGLTTLGKQLLPRPLRTQGSTPRSPLPWWSLIAPATLSSGTSKSGCPQLAQLNHVPMPHGKVVNIHHARIPMQIPHSPGGKLLIAPCITSGIQ